jgi:thiol-disulfide isomerase/thioredoxin
MLLTLVAAGCASTGSEPGPAANPRPETNVAVNTAALRAQKHAAGVQTCPKPTGSTRAKGGMPDLTLPCLGGGPAVNLSRLRGPLVVNLFAQWCGPCREEMPYYQELHKKAGGRIKVIGIDYLDTQPGRALDLVKQSGVTYPLLADPAGNLRAPFRVRGLPGVLLIDRSGRVRDLEFTVVSSYGQLRRLVHRHLGVSP